MPEYQQKKNCCAYQHHDDDAQWGHLFQIDVATESEEDHEEAEGNQAGTEAQARDPASDLLAIHRQDRQKESAENGESAEGRRPGEGAVPEDLTLGPEPRSIDDDRFAESDQEPRGDAGEGARARCSPETFPNREGGLIARFRLDVDAAVAAGIDGISTCASDPLYSSWSLGDKQFTLSMWNTTMGAAGADFAFTEKGWKTAYVVTDQFIAYTKSLSKYFIDHYKALGGQVLLEDTYTNGDNDFSAQLARLQALSETPEVIFVSSYGTDLGLIIRAIREVGIEAPVVGGDAYDDPALFEALGEKFGSDIYFITHTWMGAEAHPDMAKFIELYQAYFDEAPDTSFVATGWDTIMLMAQAVEIAGTTDGAAVAKALEDNEFNLLTGELNYENAEDGHAPDKAAVLIGLTKGKPEFLGWRRPENPPPP